MNIAHVNNRHHYGCIFSVSKMTDYEYVAEDFKTPKHVTWNDCVVKIAIQHQHMLVYKIRFQAQGKMYHVRSTILG